MFGYTFDGQNYAGFALTLIIYAALAFFAVAFRDKEVEKLYMTPIKCNKKFIVIMYAFELLLGVYIASLRLYDFDFTALSDIFLFARETDYVDLEENILNMQSVISVLNIIISIPLLSSIFFQKKTTAQSVAIV